MASKQNIHLSLTLMTITNKYSNEGHGHLYGGASKAKQKIL
jgi:hypothetical protein